MKYREHFSNGTLTILWGVFCAQNNTGLELMAYGWAAWSAIWIALYFLGPNKGIET